MNHVNCSHSKNSFVNCSTDEYVKSYISKAFKYLVGATTVVFLLAFITLIIFVCIYGGKGLAIKSFSLTHNIWNPQQGRFGIGGFFIVTLLILFFSLIFSIILALPFALFLKIYFTNKSHIRAVLERTSQMLAGIPSVIFGLLGYTILHSLFKMNLSIMMTSIVLAIMILPNHILFMGIYMATLTDDIIYNSLSLGASRVESVVNLCKKQLSMGLLIGSLVAMTRILSETMAVSMILGNSSKFSWNLLGGARNLTSLLSLQFGEATGAWQSALFAVGLIVLLLSFSIHTIIFMIQSPSFTKLLVFWRRRRSAAFLQAKC